MQQAIKFADQFLTIDTTGHPYLSQSITDRACFSVMPVIDMAQVLTAFADRHPAEKKLRTSHFDNSGLGWVHTAEVHERRPLNAPGMNQIVVSYLSDNAPSGAIQYQITDWFILDGDRVGIAGDYEIRTNKDGTIQANYTTYTRSGRFLEANHMLAMAPRRLTQDMVGTSVVSTYHAYSGPDAQQDMGAGTCHNIIDFIGERDMGNGTRRWVLASSSDTHWPSENGHLDGYPYETTYYDLGPKDGVYDPEFGYVGYKHVYCDKNGVLDGRIAEEFYAHIVPGEYHRDVTAFLKF